MVNQHKSILAKLLANENITVQHGNYQTASFDVINRVLRLPLWKSDDKSLVDMLIGHEVGHALYTPAEGWHDAEREIPGIPRAYINIVEDIRIEKLIMRKYPGLVRTFKLAYAELKRLDLFEIAGKDVDSLPFMDRLNLKSKLRDNIEVSFSATEESMYKLAQGVETWQDVIDVCKALLQFAKEDVTPERGIDPNDTQDDEQTTNDQGTEAASDDSESRDEFDAPSNSDIDAGDESGDQDVDDDSEQPERSSNVKGAGERHQDVEDVATDAAYRNNEDKLLYKDEDGKQPQLVYGMTREQWDECTYSYNDIKESREFSFKETCEKHPLLPEYEDEQLFTDFKLETNRVVNLMVKEFELRKAAYQYSRAKSSRSGSLDVTKIHSYKFNDDIFKRITTLADAKSHGMVMLVDYSGSMSSVLPSVIKQILNLTTFCKKANIPFEVYGFTTPYGEKVHTNIKVTNGIHHGNVKILHLLSSTMKKRVYDEAFRHMFYQTVGRYASFTYANPFISRSEHLGGTPLNEVLSGWNHVIKDMRQRTGVQKIINIVLTDGDGHRMYVTKDEERYASHAAPGGIVMNIDNKHVEAKSAMSHLTSALLANMQKEYGTINIGYYLAESAYTFNGAVGRSTGLWDNEVFRAARAEANKNKFISYDNVNGYDRYFIIRSNKRELDTSNEEFSVHENAKKGEITRAFKKYAKSKKVNRLLATQFVDMVA